VENYSLGLALFDYLPVLLSVFGLYLLALAIGQTQPASRLPAMMGVCLIASGGLAKASWKLWWVLTQEDVAVLGNLLFILMAPGFLLLAIHCYSAQRVWLHRSAPAAARSNTIAATAIVLLALLASLRAIQGGNSWFFILLATASLANIAISSILIRQSWHCGQGATAALFALSISLIVSLGGLSRFSAGSAPLQWLAECLNTAAHGSFALAMWRLKPFIPIAPGQPDDSTHIKRQ
jgi:hypothetical protein